MTDRLRNFGTGAAGLIAAGAIRRWMATLDYRWANYDPAVDPRQPECRETAARGAWLIAKAQSCGQ